MLGFFSVSENFLLVSNRKNFLIQFICQQISSFSIQFANNNYRFYSISVREKFIISVSVRRERKSIISVHVSVSVQRNITGTSFNLKEHKCSITLTIKVKQT